MPFSTPELAALGKELSHMRNNSRSTTENFWSDYVAEAFSRNIANAACHPGSSKTSLASLKRETVRAMMPLVSAHESTPPVDVDKLSPEKIDALIRKWIVELQTVVDAQPSTSEATCTSPLVCGRASRKSKVRRT